MGCGSPGPRHLSRRLLASAGMTSRAWIVTLVLAAAAMGGCKKSAEKERAEALRAQERAQKAIDQADEERRELLAAVARERSETIDKLDKEVRAIDKQVVALPEDGGTAERDRLVGRRELLRSDIDLVQGSTEANWDEVKAKVERDLSGGGPGRI